MAFALSGPTAISIKQGESAFANYQAARTSKPYRKVSFSVSGLPAGFTASFSPVSGTPTVTTTLKITASLMSPVGNFTIFIHARDAKSTKTIEVTLSNYLNRPVDPPAFVPDYYASPTGAGNHNGLTEANAMQISEFWAVASPGGIGKKLGLLDGVYTGVNSMINPTTGLSGTSGNRVTVRAINDGEVRINAQSARVPLLLIDNDWFSIEGINFHAANAAMNAVASIQSCANTQVKRSIFWDCLDATNSSTVVVEGTPSSLLIEDCAAFGIGRKHFSWFDSGTSDSCVFRRCWGVWQNMDFIGPKMPFSICYNSYNGILENCVSTWRQEMAEPIDQPYCLLGMDHQDGANPSNAKIYGCIGYIRGSDTVDTDFISGGWGSNNTIQGITFEHNVIYIEPGTHTAEQPWNLNNFTSADSNRLFTRNTEIGGAASTIQNQWVITGRIDSATVPTGVDNIWDGSSSNGARVLYRYENGTLTGVKLWPWPMDARINAALTTSGRNPDDYFGAGNTLTGLMESIFGAIP